MMMIHFLNHCWYHFLFAITDKAPGECYTSQRGTDYRGNISVTRFNNTCLNWNCQAVLTLLTGFSPKRYWNVGLGDHNFCRRARTYRYPWCITKGPLDNIKMEACNVGPPRASCLDSMDPLVEERYVCDKCLHSWAKRIGTKTAVHFTDNFKGSVRSSLKISNWIRGFLM